MRFQEVGSSRRNTGVLPSYVACRQRQDVIGWQSKASVEKHTGDGVLYGSVHFCLWEFILSLTVNILAASLMLSLFIF
jgi:hypothetical protein